jgi:hypothetical protein
MMESILYQLSAVSLVARLRGMFSVSDRKSPSPIPRSPLDLI